jgi:hypothetical protein
VLAPGRVRSSSGKPSPDFQAFYGTFAASAGRIVPRRYIEAVGEEVS